MSDGLSPAPRIGLYFSSITQHSYLIAKTIALGGCDVWVRMELPLPEILNSGSGPSSPVREYCSWLYSDEQIRVLSETSCTPAVDALLYELGSRSPRFPRQLWDWMRKARRVVAWNTNFYESSAWMNIRGELSRIVRFWRFLVRTRAVVMTGGPTHCRLTAPLGRASRQGLFVHPRFLREPGLRAEMFAFGWPPDAIRPIRLFFSGNPQPELRRRLIGEIGAFIESRPEIRVLHRYQESLLPDVPSSAEKAVLWMIRADEHDHQWWLREDVVPPPKWPEVLRLSDFSLCPPGYERKTHRVIESLLQGAIPILDCPEEYDIGLRDGHNCIVVRSGRWIEALQRVLQMREGDILGFRRAVSDVVANRLLPRSAAQEWLHRLDVR
jgi:hypothetical protein